MEELKVTGEMPTNEVWKASRFIGGRVFGMARWAPLAYVLIGAGLSMAVSDSDWAYEHPGMAGAIALLLPVAGVVGGFVHLKRIVKTAPQKRGGLPVITMSFEIAEKGLKVATPYGEALNYWSAFDEIASNQKYWIFIVDRSAYVLPKRFFPDSAAERRFISVVWSRLRVDAKARSTKAADYLKTAA